MLDLNQLNNESKISLLVLNFPAQSNIRFEKEMLNYILLAKRIRKTTCLAGGHNGQFAIPGILRAQLQHKAELQILGRGSQKADGILNLDRADVFTYN